LIELLLFIDYKKIMSLQYISDNKGQTTGVFIPIEEWNNLKSKFKGIEAEELDIPSWQLAELDNRVEEYRKNPTQTIDFNQAIEDIENDI
jgi:hypothetical protein